MKKIIIILRLLVFFFFLYILSFPSEDLISRYAPTVVQYSSSLKIKLLKFLDERHRLIIFVLLFVRTGLIMYILPSKSRTSAIKKKNLLFTRQSVVFYPIQLLSVTFSVQEPELGMAVKSKNLIFKIDSSEQVAVVGFRLGFRLIFLIFVER